MISLAWQNNPGGEWALLKQSLNNGASNKAIRSGGGTGTRAAREKNGAPINKAQIEKKTASRVHSVATAATGVAGR